MELLALIGLVTFYVILAAGAFLVLFGLPGTWVIWVAVAIFSFVADFQVSDWIVIVLTLIMALLGEGIEFMVGVMGSKKMDVSNGAIVASIVGGIIGAVMGVPIFLIGSVLGMLLGVFLGAWLWEWIATQQWKLSLQKAVAATFSRVISMFVKFAIALIMILYVSWQIF